MSSSFFSVMLRLKRLCLSLRPDRVFASKCCDGFMVW